MLNITYCQRNANEDLRLIRTAAIRKEKKRASVWWGCKMVHPLGQIVWQFFKKLKTELPMRSSPIPLPGTHPEEFITGFPRDCCTLKFTELFTEPRGESHPRLWIYKQNMVYTYNRISCSL